MGATTMVRVVLCAVSVLLGGVSTAGSAPDRAGHVGAELKSLSPRQISDYLSGKGMGLARAAEVHGYPGPAHVLELAKELDLTADQQARTQALFGSMRVQAVALGKEVVDVERVLDHLFASRTVTLETLRASVARVATLEGELRRVHLDAHIAQATLLTREQLARYAVLRARDVGVAPERHDHDHR